MFHIAYIIHTIYINDTTSYTRRFCFFRLVSLDEEVVGIEGNEGLSKQVPSQEKSSFLSAWGGTHNNIQHIFHNLATDPRRQDGGQHRRTKFFYFVVALDLFATGNTRNIGSRSI